MGPWARQSLATLAAALFAFLLISSAAQALEPVTLQLKWRHAFQFAGYYAAQAQGYYRDAGLDVHIQEARPGLDVVETVLSGAADYGIGSSGLVLSRAQGKPVVALAVVFQHSPLAIAAAGDGETQNLHSLAGKRVMIEHQAEDLLAYFIQEGLPLNSVNILEHSFDINDLLSGKVDAASVYVTNEPYFLRKAGFPYHIYSPRAAGVDFYGDTLFTTESELADHPERVRAFRAASLKGWAYALAHPQEVIDRIEALAPGRAERAFYEFEAQRTAPLIRADLVEIGYMNPGRWRAIAETYADRGLVPRDFSLKGFLFAEPSPVRWRDYAPYIIATATLAALFAAIAGYVWRINRRLAVSLRDLAASEALHRQLAQSLRHMAQHDPLTGLPNRALFSDRLEQALAAARRHGHGVAVAFTDLDNFKPVNDRHGHDIGDRLLVQVAERLRSCLRASDTAARVGGDEFVFLLPQVENSTVALQVAEKVRTALGEPFTIDGRRLTLSASIGIALYPDHGDDEIVLTRCADAAMYAIKRDGRNGCRLYRRRDEDITPE